ncbi:restriction endonuclease [Vibrio vulnificus]|uniref:restriction endonuclease n=1 Tax=Vibrio TaxID=662 RepID=UPI00193D958B|nr:restriction endonuclease [Vibrio vulnificus]MBM4873888.1 restriction endonuclease [Vibrio parahaemolyticus]MDS1846535.1 restriction endonuclease [Vibrio vulnificus]HAS6982634.1 hypothetical protein [Vibrio parahaemolyticus]HAS8286786.1 hypothetical protein [Vibrio vulnificus]
MEGYIQTGIGIAVSLFLFWLSYRQTIGAKKERTVNANKSLHRAIMRRIVLEEYVPKIKDLSRIREGKAREFNTSANDMLSEEQVLTSVYTEVFDSDLIPPSQRISIESRLDTVFAQLDNKRKQSSFREYESLKDASDSKKHSLVVMSALVSAVGAVASMMFSYLQDPSSIAAENPQWLFSGVGVFVVSLTMITYLVFLRKEKDSFVLSNRSQSMLNALNFEIEVAKTIEKSGIQYTTEPRVGRFRPDFLLSLNNKKIAVEAKSWSDNIPLSIQANTVRKLEAMVEEEEIDSVFLVTKKSQPSRGLSSGNSKVLVMSLQDFNNYLKNSRAA